MAFIERLFNDDWKQQFRQVFEETLKILKEEPDRYAGSSIDDMKIFLWSEGVSSLKMYLGSQMKSTSRISEKKQKEIFNFLEVLLKEKKEQLLELVNLKRIAVKSKKL